MQVRRWREAGRRRARSGAHLAHLKLVLLVQTTNTRAQGRQWEARAGRATKCSRRLRAAAHRVLLRRQAAATQVSAVRDGWAEGGAREGARAPRWQKRWDGLRRQARSGAARPLRSAGVVQRVRAARVPRRVHAGAAQKARRGCPSCTGCRSCSPGTAKKRCRHKRVATIYLIRSPSGKAYVGQTMWPYVRMKSHASGASWKCKAIAAAIAKHGWDKMQYEVIRGGPDAVGGECKQDELDELERHYIALFGTRAPRGYNLTDGGDVNPALEDGIRERLAAMHASGEIKEAQRVGWDKEGVREGASSTHKKMWEDPAFKAERLRKLAEGRQRAKEQRGESLSVPSSRTRKLKRNRGGPAMCEGTREKATESKLRKAEERWRAKAQGMRPERAAAFLKRKFADRERHQAQYQARKAAHQG